MHYCIFIVSIELKKKIEIKSQMFNRHFYLKKNASQKKYGIALLDLFDYIAVHKSVNVTHSLRTDNRIEFVDNVKLYGM